MSIRRSRVVAFAIVTAVTAVLFIAGIGTLTWRLMPLPWSNYLEVADGTIPLLILFLLVPAGLALLGGLGLIFGAWLMSRFITRAEAEQAILSSTFGGHLGSIERKILSWYQP